MVVKSLKTHNDNGPSTASTKKARRGLNLNVSAMNTQAEQGVQGQAVSVFKKSRGRKREDPGNEVVFSRDGTTAILVSQNNKTAAMLVSQTNPMGVELFSYVKTFFCSNNGHITKTCHTVHFGTLNSVPPNPPFLYLRPRPTPKTWKSGELDLKPGDFQNMR